jgi:drug/metabolite transporter (DMT)-like permease
VGLVVILGLAASLFYGASDFLGALSARRLTVLKASVAIYVAATAVVGVALFITPWFFSGQALWAGSVAGAFAAVGMVTFYAALAIGPMSLLAPLISLIQTSIPVVVAAVIGQSLPPVAWIAVAIAILATMLISVPARATVERISARGGLLALVSGVTLGLSVVSLNNAPPASGLFPAFLDVGVGLLVIAPLLVVPRLRTGDGWLKGAHSDDDAPDREPAGARVWAMTAIGGVLLGIGNILLIIALHTGNLAVVAVLVSLYPLATVLLAWAVLKERISLVQFCGVALAITAAIMLGVA